MNGVIGFSLESGVFEVPEEYKQIDGIRVKANNGWLGIRNGTGGEHYSAIAPGDVHQAEGVLFYDLPPGVEPIILDS